MKKLAFAAVVAGALTCVASDSSYTYTPGDTSLGGGAVTITYAAGTTDIATLTANPSNGGTITLTGGAATFAAGATLTLATSGTVSFAERVTTKGALTLTRSDGAYIVWTDTTALTETQVKPQSWVDAFNNGAITGDAFEPSSLVFVSTTQTNSLCPGRFDLYVEGPSSNIFALNRVTADHSYTIRPQIGAGGIRCITISRSQRFGYYPKTALWANNSVKGLDKGHWCNATITDGGAKLGRVYEWGLTKCMVAKKGMAALANIRFDGGAVLGGETSVAAGMEAVLAVMEEGDNAITGTNVPTRR